MQFAVRVKSLAVAFFIVFLGACGGGGGGGGGSGDGGGSNNPPPKAPLAQSLFFIHGGPIAVSVGETVNNPAMGPGTGQITYTASSTGGGQVEIGSFGAITGRVAGSVTVRADKAADSDYQAASATYTVDVVAADAELKAWIGASDTLVDLPPSARGLALYRSTDTDCDVLFYTSCLHAEVDVFSGAQIVDTMATVTQPAIYTLKSASRQSQLAIGTSHFSARSGHQVVRFDDKLWLIGGADWGSNFNDVWSSPDGATWIRVAGTAQFSARHGHQVVAFKNKLWLIGGNDGASKDDVWSSNDGASWQQEPVTGQFAPRAGHRVVVFNDRLWLIGGYDNTGTYRNDVWSSADGVNWRQDLASAPFSARSEHALAVYDNRLWLVGGNRAGGGGGQPVLNDVWSSADGVNWGQVTASAAFSGRFRHTLTVFNNHLVLTGGNLAGIDSDEIWVSGNGADWNEVFHDQFFSRRGSHQAVELNGRLLIIGGTDQFSSNIYNDVWAAGSDLSQWKRWTSVGEFSPRTNFSAVVKNDELLIVGGRNFWNLSDGVWSSSDGISWAPRSTYAFTQRSAAATVVFKDQIWMVGGENGNAAYPSIMDVWSSSDGRDWGSHVYTGSITPRSGHQVVVFQDQMWLVGGVGSLSSYFNDVWSSTDGINWTQRTAAAAFSPRSGHQLVSFDNKLWLIGGYDGSDELNDVWSSNDGVTWTQRTASAEFPGRDRHQVVVYDGQMWLAGGDAYPQMLDDVWSSSNGVNWTKRVDHAAFAPRAGHQMVVFGDRMLLIGGGAGSSGTAETWSSTDGIEWRRGYHGSFHLQ